MIAMVRKDWGDLDDEDRRLNDQAIENGSRILSAYHTSDGAGSNYAFGEIMFFFMCFPF